MGAPLGNRNAAGNRRPDTARRNRASAKHGHTRAGGVTPTWRAWRNMHTRCYDPANASWEWYGGRGITVCAAWTGADGFANFLADMGERPEGLTLDRIDPDEGYSADNCRWATWREQALNRRPRRKPEPRSHCKRNHALAGENLYVTPDGRRQCRTCARLRAERM